MRAVTFSDPKTNELINQNFIVTWFNQAPSLFPRRPVQTCTQHNVRTLSEGAGGPNVKCFFCTPQGKIVHFIQGYYGPEVFQREVAFARTVLLAAGEKKDARLRIRALHEQRMATLREEHVGRRKGLRYRRQIANHRIASQRLLRDPKPFMVNDVVASG